MAAQIRAGHKVGKELRRIAVRRVRDALDALSHVPARDKDIHDARRSLKKSRATLRLMRRAAGSKMYHRENAELRDLARPLSAARDAAVLLQALDSLAGGGSGAGARGLRELRSVLRHQRSEARKAVGQAEQEKARRQLRASMRRLSHLKHPGHGWKMLEPDLRRTYAAARNAMHASRTRPDALHEWRKQAKYVRYQLHTLRPAWPRAAQRLDTDLSELVELLGDDHDLAVLRVEVLRHRSSFDRASSSEALLKKLDRRRAALQRRARALGERAFAATPGRYARSLESGFRAWRTAEQRSRA